MPTILRSNGVKKRMATGFGEIVTALDQTNSIDIKANFRIPIDFFPSILMIHSIRLADFCSILQIGDKWCYSGGHEVVGVKRIWNYVQTRPLTKVGDEFVISIFRTKLKLDESIYWVAIE